MNDLLLFNQGEKIPMHWKLIFNEVCEMSLSFEVFGLLQIMLLKQRQNVNDLRILYS